MLNCHGITDLDPTHGSHSLDLLILHPSIVYTLTDCIFFLNEIPNLIKKNYQIWFKKFVKSNKVWGKKKCTRVCVYYKNYARFRQKSIKSAKSTHPENSKLVRQVHVVQKVPPGSMIEQKNGFCENTIFVKNYLQKKVHLHLWISCKIC